jgi:hypothetical protein
MEAMGKMNPGRAWNSTNDHKTYFAPVASDIRTWALMSKLGTNIVVAFHRLHERVACSAGNSRQARRQ